MHKHSRGALHLWLNVFVEGHCLQWSVRRVLKIGIFFWHTPFSAKSEVHTVVRVPVKVNKPSPSTPG